MLVPFGGCISNTAVFICVVKWLLLPFVSHHCRFCCCCCFPFIFTVPLLNGYCCVALRWVFANERNENENENIHENVSCHLYWCRQSKDELAKMDISSIPFPPSNLLVFSYYSTTRLLVFASHLYSRRTNSMFFSSLLNLFFVIFKDIHCQVESVETNNYKKTFPVCLLVGCAMKKTVRNTKWVMNCCVKYKEGSFNVLHCSLYPWSSCNNFSALASFSKSCLELVILIFVGG